LYQFLFENFPMCSTELWEWLSLIVFESNQQLNSVLSDLRSMTVAERQELLESHYSHWPPFDLARIEDELSALIAQHGNAVTMDQLSSSQQAAA
jgi:hypothetical protein